jgi:hypothetical protein
MFKILSIAALSIGMASSAMAGGGSAGGLGGGANGAGTHVNSRLTGDATTDTMATGSIDNTMSHKMHCKGSTAQQQPGSGTCN